MTSVPIARPIFHSLLLFSSLAFLVASLILPYAMVMRYSALAMDRQRAREIASVCGAAQDAGLDPVEKSGLEATIRRVVRGGKAADRMFFVPGVTESDIPRVAKHLKISSGKLQYASNDTYSFVD